MTLSYKSFAFFCCFPALVLCFIVLLTAVIFLDSIYAQTINHGNTGSITQTPTFLNNTTRYLYGCTYYRYLGFHCDPISTEFESYSVLADSIKIASASREPDYKQAKFGLGVHTTGTHALESLRADIINAYNATQFSVYLSVRPDGYDDTLGNGYVSLLSYKNGVRRDDPHTAGWEIEFVPNDSNSTKKLRFTVFDIGGNRTSPKDVDIPVEKFSEIAGTFDGKTIRLFVNGTLRSEIAFSGFYGGDISNGTIKKRDNFLTIGGDAYCTCYLASGIFDEVRYYNYSLTSEQIKEINSPADTLGKGLVGHWKFDGDLKDYSTFRNDMFYNTIIASMAFSPDGKLFYTEKNSGNIRIMVNDTILERPFVSIPNIYVDFELGLLGLAIDSKFTTNHFLYVYYNYKDENTGKVYARIVRFTNMNNSGTDPTILLDRIPTSYAGFHTGGALTFNSMDDKLYVTVGDSINGKIAQNISSLNGKTLRINRDGTIPAVNPFPNSPVYTYGHRNMFGIAFNELGQGIITEPGASLYDEINPIVKGANYGWPTMPPANIPPDPLVNDSSIKPIRSYYDPPNPTQAIYYNGDMHPELKGKFIVGSFRGDLYAYNISKDGRKLLEEVKLVTSVYPLLEVVGVAVSPSGELYFGAYDIFKLVNIDDNSKVQTMHSVQINATNVKVSSVNYSEPTKELKVKLTDRHGLSTLSVRIPKSLIDHISGQAKPCTNKSEVYSRLDLDSRDQCNIVNIKFPYDAPTNLELIISKSQIIAINKN